MTHLIGFLLQNDLPGHPGLRVDGDGTFQVHGALRHGVFHHAQHIEAQGLTLRHPQRFQLLGLELGADDYITKPFDNKELVLRVKTLWRRIRLTRGAVEAAPPPPEPEGAASRPSAVLVAGSEVSLTYREFDVLCYLMQNRRRVLGREELLENIWGYSFMGNTRAVDILMGRLRQKLGSAGEYIRTVYGVGYRFEGPEK